MNTTRILMLLEVDFPPDNRVEKEILTLKQQGFEVELACLDYNNKLQNKQIEIFYHKGIKVYKKHIPSIIYKLSVAALVVPFYFNFWKNFINKILSENQFDIIHVHDLPLAKVGYYYKKHKKMKLVCDQHEYYSNWIIHTAHYNTFIGKIIRLLSNWKKYERHYLSQADMVITVEEPLRTKYIQDVKLPAEKIITLPNTPEKSVFNIQNLNQDIINRYANNYMLFYAGGLDILRGIDVAIEALPILAEKISNIKLVLVGKISRYYPLREKIAALHLENFIELPGFIPYEDIPSYISASKMCFFTPLTNRDEIHNTIPTKIYQFLAMERPVIVSNAKMMADFVESKEIGLVIKKNNSEEFAEAVIKYYGSTSMQQNIAKGCRMNSNNYFWDNTANNFIKTYFTIL